MATFESKRLEHFPINFLAVLLGLIFFQLLAYAMMLILSVIMVYVIDRTVKAIRNHEICSED